jgi:hypothetical protein
MRSGDDEGSLIRLPSAAPEFAPSTTQIALNRAARLGVFRAKFVSEEVAVFAALGVETAPRGHAADRGHS